MTINNLYKIGSVVFIKTAPDKKKGIITEIIVSGLNASILQYHVRWTDSNCGWHYEYELTDEFLHDFDTT